MRPTQIVCCAEDEVSLRSGSLSKDEARAELQTMLGEEVTAQLEDPLWKTRLLGMDSVMEALPTLNLAQSSSKLAQCIVQIPGWKDTNFQVRLAPRKHVLDCMSLSTCLPNE